MKNVYYLFLVLIGLLCSLSTSAKKVLYSQNFETATSVAETGWTAAGLSIGSDEKGKFLRFVPSGNDRSAHLFWDAALIKNELSADFTSYQITFGFSFNKFGNNHMTSEIAVMSEESVAKKKSNLNYRSNNKGALFDLTQLGNTGRTAAIRTLPSTVTQPTTRRLPQAFTTPSRSTSTRWHALWSTLFCRQPPMILSPLKSIPFQRAWT